VHTDRVPDAAVLGTFWAIPEARPLRATIAAWHETVRPTTEESACLSTLELLRANEGRVVTLGLGDKDLTGKLLDVLEAPGLRTKLSASGDGTYETELAPRGGELLALEIEKTRQVLPVAAVKTLSGKDLSTHCVRSREVATRTKRLTFDFGPEAAGKAVKLELLYFTPGVRWIPTYRVGTSAASRAELELQAEILNEEEDFERAAVDLVVGAPSFKFKGTVSPMSLEQTLRAALTQAMPALMMNNLGIGNASFSNRAGERSDGLEGSGGSVMGLAAELGASAHEDFFVYPVKSLGLKKGARAMVPLWKSRVPQRHLYTVDFGTFARSDGARLTENKVQHELELTDDTDVPFTTGAAMLMSGSVPLGQELLGYTSPGGRTLIHITTALDVRAQQSERETSRTANARVIDDRQYTLLQKKGTITVSSARKERSTVRVALSTQGKVERASHGGAVVVDELDRVNNQSRVTWEVTVGAGETVTLGYDLSVLR
jgi:hypothetical protein